MSINNFKIQSISSDTILVNLPAKCNRPMNSTLHHLFSNNFAPTSQNGILLQNCSSVVEPCMIPSTVVETQFEFPHCGNNSMSCYYEKNNKTMFLDYDNLARSDCGTILSAISVEHLGGSVNDSAVSLEVQFVQLGWWLHGGCRCSKHAHCTKVVAPLSGRLGFRCRCKEGYGGNGYRDGSGCFKESTSCSPSNYMSGECGGTTRVAVLVGGVMVGACLMITLGLICCCIRRRNIRNNRSKTKRQLCNVTGITIPIYPYKQIEKATNFFCDKQRLGNGAYGTVYSGRLQNDSWAAIKRIKHRDIGSIDQVINEIKLLSSVEHPNLVRLLGCSIEKGEQILVYEYMPNGTLSQHLRREKGDGLTWHVRLAVAAETAQGIAYLHNAMHPPIFHRDIKSSNILLDYNFKSKVADFGLSRLGCMMETSHISTAPQGTPGYLDPQYHQDFHLSDKSDVYSFGVVLVEIITGLKAVDFSRAQNEINLSALAVDRIGKGRLEEIIDPYLQPDMDPWTRPSLHKVAEMAFRCLAFHRDARPSMMEVAIELEQIRLNQWPNSDVCFTSLLNTPHHASPIYNASEKQLKTDNNDSFHYRDSMDITEDLASKASTPDSWPSEQSSPSTSSLINHVIP
ncbi:hypothetical protein Leryth_011917 [Lithospermum erythrorhizon]|nr:hypothetical protein Leryth_011917 [Lithospermum erythrorhizon]